jgi:hypothetical protein
LYDFVRFRRRGLPAAIECRTSLLSYAADLLLRDRGGAGSSVDVKMR